MFSPPFINMLLPRRSSSLLTFLYSLSCYYHQCENQVCVWNNVLNMKIRDKSNPLLILFRIEGSVIAAKYREVLEKNLLQSAHNLRLGRQFTFQHDNDPKHTPKTMLQWLWDKSLIVLKWPSQSPDLNPMEHLWRDLKLAGLRCFPSNLMELDKICQEDWDKLPKFRWGRLVENYPRRLKAVIAAKGTSTILISYRKMEISVFDFHFVIMDRLMGKNVILKWLIL